MYHETSCLHKLIGFAGSAAVAAMPPLLANLPPLLAEAEIWLKSAMVFGGALGMAYYLFGLHLDVCKKRRDEREYHRQEMREIQRKTEDAVCLQRRQTLICPMLKKQMEDHSDETGND